MSDDSTTKARNRLQQLYGHLSKHASYQSIPDFVSDALGYRECIQRNWRDDRNRYDYILSQLAPLTGEKWADFGANTGFFTFSLAHAFPLSNFLAIEAAPHHVEFLNSVKQIFDLSNIEICPESFGIEHLDRLEKVDIMLHLNVLHHAGDDFDRNLVSGPSSFLPYAARYLSRLRSIARVLVLQIGFNLWGKKDQPIFPISDSIAALAAFRSLISSAGWKFRAVAYPVLLPTGDIAYRNLTGTAVDELKKEHQHCDWKTVGEEISSLGLDAHIGEFYHRPIFLLEQ